MRTLSWDLVQCVTNPETFGTIITAICNQNEPLHGDTEINVIIAVSPSWRRKLLRCCRRCPEVLAVVYCFIYLPGAECGEIGEITALTIVNYLYFPLIISN